MDIDPLEQEPIPTKRELRLWLYASPIVAFALANSYTFAGTPRIPGQNFIDSVIFFGLLILPLLLPVRSVKTILYIVVLVVPETIYLTLAREWAQFGQHPFKSQDPWFIAIMASATIVVPILLMSIKNITSDCIQDWKRRRADKSSITP